MTAPAQPDLRQRIAAAIASVPVTIGPNSLALLQHGHTLGLTGGEIDAMALTVLAEVVQPLLDQRETLQLGALEREALLCEARDALEAAGQNGAHGDDWPAIAPAIRELAAELDRVTIALEVATAQHAKTVAARDKAQQRAKISDDIQRAEKQLFDSAIRDLGGEPVQVQNLYAQLRMRTRQWKDAKTEAEQLRAQLAAVLALPYLEKHDRMDPAQYAYAEAYGDGLEAAKRAIAIATAAPSATT